jgi:hypothetical protein
MPDHCLSSRRRPLSLCASSALVLLLPLALLPLGASPARAQLWDARDRFLPVPNIPQREFMRYGEVVASCDWDGDGRADLAVGMPEYNDDAGAVFFYRMDPQGSPVFAGAVGTVGQESLGAAVACGDFDGDGDAEAAAGAPQFALGGIEEGRVVLYDWVGGTMVETGEFRQSLADVAGAAEDFDEFGGSLAVGDFDADGADDLAVGSPGEDVGATNAAGAVTFFYGELGVGLVVAGNSIWHKDTTGVVGDPGVGENVGLALAVIRNDCDAFADLAVGVPGQTVDGVEDAGAVYVVHGSAGGLVHATSFVLDTTSFTQGGASPPHTSDRFGATLASAGAYFPGACGTIAIGAPGREVGGVDGAGALYLRRDGGGSSRYFTAADFGVAPDLNDHFAESFAFADFNADSRLDLVVGMPRYDPALSSFTGGVFVGLSSNGQEPDPANAQLIVPRSTLELFEFVTDNGSFGQALVSADFDGDSVPDLAVGLPSADYVDLTDAGGVQILYGGLFAADFEGGNDNEW